MIYNLVRALLYMVICLISIFNKKARIFAGRRLFQDFELRRGKYFWVHCASVGEINLSESLVRKLLAKGNERVLVTMMTDTGMATAKAKYEGDDRVHLLYFPLDDLLAIRKILRNISLQSLIIVETEIWPNLIREAAKRSKVCMVNGRISDKSFGSYKKFDFYLRGLFKRMELFLMQTEEDSQRIIELGAPEGRVENIGNLKFDIELEDFTDSQIEEIKRELHLEERRIIVAGSTRDDEEEYVLEAYEELKEDYFLFLVPRHIERTEDICARLLEGNYRYQRWSQMAAEGRMEIEEDTQIVVVDAIGVLRKLYAISHAAYVGGTLVDVGGHSLLEPLYYRKPPIFGGYLQNVKEISSEVIKRKIGYKIEGSRGFVEAVRSLERDDVKTKDIDDFFEENGSSTEKAYERIIDII